jgi:cold shock CspA family protein
MMRGTMVWFNEEKGHGYISTEAGERLYVSQQGFAGGNAPKGRCAGLPVEFEIATNIDGREAVGSMLVEEDAPPRARRRHRAGR